MKTLVLPTNTRFIFVDEAGTSGNQPITIVIALTMTWQQVTVAHAYLTQIFETLPNNLKNEFVFHASDIWGEKYRKDWTTTDRAMFMKRVMNIPKILNVPISMGMIRRETGILGKNWEIKSKHAPEKLQHGMAFAMCLTRVDKYIRDHCSAEETGKVIAEDVPKMKKILSGITAVARNNPFELPKEAIRPTLEEKELGYIKQNGEMSISRIETQIHFAKKKQEPMLQLADACAFGLKRYFSELSYGKEFARYILGYEPKLEDFAGPDTFYTWVPLNKNFH